MRKVIKRIAVVLITVMSFQSAAPLLAAVATIVPGGTMVKLRVSQTVTSANASVGQSVSFSVTNNVTVKGVVVIKAGALATGTVNTVKIPSLLGSPGQVGVSLTSVTAVDGTEIPIMASASRDGANKQVTSIILGLLCILGFLIKGGDGELQAGSTIDARTMGEVTVEG